MLQAKVEFDGTALKEGIQSVLKLAAPYTGTVNISISKNEFLIESRAELSIAFVKIPFSSIELETDEPVKFGIVLEQLRVAIGNRKGKITLALENVVLKIAATSYRAELTTVDYVEYPEIKAKLDQSVELSKEQAEWLKSTVNAVALKPNLISPIMPVTVYADNSGITVSCYARDHIVFTRSDKVTGNLNFAVPIESFAAIFNVFGKNEFVLNSSDSFVQAKNDNISVYISLPVTDAYLPVETLLDRIEAFSNVDGNEVKIDYRELSEFFTNMKAVAMSERPEVIISSNKNTIIFECKTSLGTIRHAVKSEDALNVDIKVDAEYLKEAVAKTDKKDVIIKCCQDNGFVLIPLKEGSCSVIALNS